MKATATVYCPEGIDPFANFTTRPARTKVQAFLSLLRAIIAGGILGRAANRPTVVVGTTYATCVVTLASVSNADTVTINGAALTAVVGTATAEQFDQSGTNAADATSFVAAVNTTSAAARIAGLVRASNLSGTLTLSTCVAGSYAEIAGIRITAMAAASAKPDEFTIAGDNTADAAALVVTINAHPALKELVKAYSALGVVTVFQLPFGSTTGLTLLGSGMTANVTRLTAAAAVLLVSRGKGTEGNCFTIATADGTRLAITQDSSGYFTGGAVSTLTF